jgi:hypothetical protein
MNMLWFLALAEIKAPTLRMSTGQRDERIGGQDEHEDGVADEHGETTTDPVWQVRGWEEGDDLADGVDTLSTIDSRLYPWTEETHKDDPGLTGARTVLRDPKEAEVLSHRIDRRHDRPVEPCFRSVKIPIE